MEFFQVVLIIIILLFCYFIISHLRPLDINEINILGNKRRSKGINNYYSFTRMEVKANKEFKSSMDKGGRHYVVNESLSSFPAKAASLLKYKKHEWVIVGFENEQKVLQIWCNKGEDNSSVKLKISDQDIVNIAVRKKITTVLFFHNHPNSNPSQYTMNKPSEQDLRWANYWSSILVSYDVNLLQFVCERGGSYEYYRSISDKFLPLKDFMEEIEKINGQSKWSNFGLHIERIF